jgi:ATP-dependent helicase HepA
VNTSRGSFNGPLVVEFCGRLRLQQELADEVLGKTKPGQEHPKPKASPAGSQPPKQPPPKQPLTRQSLPKQPPSKPPPPNEPPPKLPPAPPSAPEPPKRPPPLFKIGQEVLVRADPSQRGIVLSVFWGQGEWEYEVFLGAQDKRIYRESDLAALHADVEWVRLEELLRNLALVKLRNALSDNLYALHASRTEFEVYQFRPAMKFLGNPDQRLLIADEVGLGKTIEAGIIYLEMQARLELNRVLVVCPSGLRAKWQDELKLRFDEDFDILDSNGIERFFSRYEQYGANHRLRGIVSLELLRRPEFADRFVDPPVHLDLVIIDEAHHCRNTGTRSNNLATVLSDSADAMLLLTATPLQIGNEDLFNLLNILSPGEFDNLFVFLDRLEPNQFINRAGQILATGNHRVALDELRKVEQTREKQRFTGNPYYTEVVRTLGEKTLTQDDLVKTQRRLVELNTLANIFTRTRKREIGEKVPTRSAHTIKVEFTPAEARFYNRIIRHVRQEFANLHGSNYVAGFVSIMRERQAASCISAARQRFADLAKEESLPEEEQSYLDPALVGEWDDDETLSMPPARARWYRDVVRQLNDGQIDTKFEKFVEALRLVLAEDNDSKILVFSFFRHTIEYLYGQLSRLGIRVQYIHGGIKVGDRPPIIDHFRQDPEIRVLISSEVGAEGLDFQFCNTIFNYDLPWNPMRVEQRIGRIDRFGQKSPKIRIFNMVIANTVEERILLRLYERIGLFKHAIGDIEAILGEEIRELSKRVYSSELSPVEEMTLAEQAAQNIIRRQQEMEEFEEKRLQFMGQEAIFSTLVNQTIESGNFLSDVEVRGLVSTFIDDAFKRAHLDLNRAGGKTFALDVDHDLAAHIRGFVQRNRRVDRMATDFVRKLEPGKVLPVTFSSDMAQERKLLSFVTARHPLTQAAADYWVQGKQVDLINNLAHFGVRSDSLRPGAYYFFLFLLKSSGVEQATRLVPVTVVAENGDVYAALSQQLLRLIQTSAFDCSGPLPKLEQAEMSEAERMAMIYMTARRDEIKAEINRSNEALVNARLAAITQSYEAKQRRVEQLRREAKDDRIIRMRQGQLRNMEAEYRLKKGEITKQRSVSVSFSLALRGYVVVEKV